MVSALGSMLDVGEIKGLTDEQILERVDAAIDGVPDLAGTFYKYSLAGSLLGGRVR
jgi:F420-non-reducing hydrogenase small subunit